eukprot:UN25235
MWLKGNDMQQEVALIVLRNMVPITGGEPFQTYCQVFNKGLGMRERIKFESLKGFKELTSVFAGDKEKGPAIKNILIQMAKTCKEFVTHKEEDMSRYVIEVWSDLATEGALVGCESDILKFMLEIVAEKRLAINVRYQTLEYLKYYAKQLPNKLINEKLLEKCMKVCIGLLMESYQDNEDSTSSPLTMAIEFLDAIFLNVNAKHTTSMALKGVEQLIKDKRIRSALALLAIMTEGCVEVLKEEELLKKLVQVQLNGMQSQDAQTRRVAYEALTQFVYHVSPEMNKFAPDLMKAIFASLKLEGRTPKKSNLEAICLTLDSYCAALNEEIKPWLPSIVDTLMSLLQTSNDSSVQEAAISGLSSTIMTAREHRLEVPKLGDIVPLLLKVICSKDDKIAKIRGEATNCMGEVCLIAGAQKTKQIDSQSKFIDTIIACAKNTEDTTLKEFSFVFFGTLAELFGGSLVATKQFEEMYKIASVTLRSEDGLEKQKDDDGLGTGKAPGMGEDSDGEDGLEIYKFYCATGFLEEKTAAAHTLQKFAEHCGHHYHKYWEDALESIVDCFSYPHPTLKTAIIRAYHSTCMSIIKSKKATTNQDGVDKNFEKNIKEGMQWLQMAVTLYVVSTNQDDEKEVVAETLVSLSEMIKEDISSVLDSNAEEFLTYLSLLFDEEAQCQNPDDDELKEAKLATEENLILDGLTEVISALCLAMTPAKLAELWTTIFPKLARYLDPKRSHVEYSLAIGCIGDVSGHFDGNLIKPFLKDSLKMAFTGLNASNHHLVKQNSVFTLGCLCRGGGNTIPRQDVINMIKIFAPLCKLPKNKKEEMTDYSVIML